MTGTRAEHMAWCKQRALAYLDTGDVTNAFASMASDIRKHDETANLAELMAIAGLPIVMKGDTAEMRRFIEGFTE